MGKNNKPNDCAGFFYYVFCSILIIAIPFTIISILISSSPHAFAGNSSADNVSFEIPSSCTLNATLNTDHAATVVNGQYISDVGTTTLKALCNDSNGFSIYTIGASNNTEGNNKLISSISTQYDIATGTAISGNISNWAMKLTPIAGAYIPTMTEGYNDQYVSVPNIWTKVASRTSNTDVSTDSDVAGSSLTTTYALYASPAQPAGTYNGQVKYVLIHPNSGAMNLISLQMALHNALGNPTTTVDGSATGTKYYRMQDMTKAICDAVTVIGGGSQIQLVDDRPDSSGIRKLYWVTKLDDGNCWMTQNLDLDLTAGTTFTHSDTDLGWTTSDAGATWTVGAGYSTIPWDPVAGKFTSWDDQNALPYSADPDEKYYYTSNTTSADTVFNSMAQCLAISHAQADCEHYHAGNYYNWTAAVAGNVTNSGNAPDSICPAGWRLPRTSADEFANLLVAHNVIPNTSSTSYKAGGFNTIRKYPMYFVRSGYVNGGTLSNAASNGYYWSSTVYNANNARYLYFYNSDVLPADYGNYSRSLGWPVRCIAR